MNLYPHLEGRSAVLDLRCSTARQSGTSIPDQIKIGRAFCDANGLTIVKVIKQEGVTASVPGARNDFDDIIRRKREKNDFDVLVLTDISRFTRAGIKHGMNAEFELEREEIEVVFATTALPAGEDADLIKPAYYFAAKMWIKTLAHAVARGMMSAFESGAMAHCNVPPHGLDFMYIVDGKPSHVTRLLPDGRQLKLHVDAMGKKARPTQILQTFPRNPKKAKPLHYRKQANEKVVLVPGDPDALATVVLIFTLFHKHDMGSRRIAVALNERGIPSPKGKLWSAVSIDYILQNRVYLGTGMTNMKTRAVYAARNPIAPKLRKVSLKSLTERRKHLPLEMRPRDDWQKKDYPLLIGLLDEDLRALAEKHIERALDRKAGIVGLSPRRRRPRHPDSDYLLTGLLTSKQGGHRMGGYSTYARNKRYRLYSITKFRTSPIRDPLLTRRVKADPLEAAVLRAMGEIFAQAPDMTAALEKAVRAEQKARLRDDRDRSDLLRERDEVREEYLDLLGLGKHGRELARQKIQQCERRLSELEARITAADLHTGAGTNPAEQARAIAAQLAGAARRLDKMPRPLLKRLAAALISRIEIDMETLEFELELALPSWAMIAPKQLTDALRLEPGSHMQTGRETQQDDRRFVLARFACTASGKPICFDCRRRRRAA
jgi:hypothetical protein